MPTNFPLFYFSLPLSLSHKHTQTSCFFSRQTIAEEWITKRKTELTTTRQIETHVKRSIRFEDGKVIEDSGPIVSTNTTEDTDKQETETTEVRNNVYY